MTGTPRACYRSNSIVADGRLEVCDGAHWAFVMKKEMRYFRGTSRHYSINANMYVHQEAGWASGRRTKSENTGACSGVYVTASQHLCLCQPPKSLIMLEGLCGKTGTVMH